MTNILMKVNQMSQTKAIDVKNLTKYYGDFLAVDPINFTVKQGEIFDFLGPNGAGKSTTRTKGCASMYAHAKKYQKTGIINE